MPLRSDGATHRRLLDPHAAGCSARPSHARRWPRTGTSTLHSPAGPTAYGRSGTPGPPNELEPVFPRGGGRAQQARRSLVGYLFTNPARVRDKRTRCHATRLVKPQLGRWLHVNARANEELHSARPLRWEAVGSFEASRSPALRRMSRNWTSKSAAVSPPAPRPAWLSS
jgi:hypothetical protein